ncbi:variable surface protein [Plasmodium gonderi]|uniref:Variable surface protein n=1 Tax=Plasmodium gonderi TaxID=77519 RepID=A0A1Y1J9M1_PLAGO|nr:variable surface protein [Plasmodium gonderi]GAW79196.1 variable surface protein [Plasmodium gonderi]
MRIAFHSNFYFHSQYTCANIMDMLPSYQIYKVLNDENGSTDIKTNSFCNDLSTNKDVIKLCKKVEGNLTRLSEIDELKNKSHNDRCLYFNYWVHGEMRKILKDKNGNRVIEQEFKKLRDKWYHISNNLMKNDFNTNYSTIIEELRNKWGVSSGNNGITNSSRAQISERVYSIKDFSKHEVCLYNSDCTFEQCDDMKSLYDYFKNVDYIKSKINNNKNICSIYSEYVKSIKPLYDKYKENCCYYWFCDYFNCNYDYEVDELLYKLKKCPEGKDINNSENTSSTSENNEFYSRINNGKSLFLNSAFPDNKTGYKYFRCYKKNDNKEDLPNVASCYEVKTNNYEGFEKVFGGENADAKIYRNLMTLRKNKTKEIDTYESMSPEIICNTLFCDPYRIGTLFILIIGLIFTPFGPWLNRVLRKKRIKSEFHEDFRKNSSKHKSHLVNKNRSNKRISIAYESHGKNRK